MAKFFSWKGQKRCINGRGISKNVGGGIGVWRTAGILEKMSGKFDEFITCKGVFNHEIAKIRSRVNPHLKNYLRYPEISLRIPLP